MNNCISGNPQYIWDPYSTRLYFLNKNLTGTTIVRVSTKVSQNKTQTLHNNRAAQYSRFMPRLLPQPWKLVYVYLSNWNYGCLLSIHTYVSDPVTPRVRPLKCMVTKNIFRLDSWVLIMSKRRKIECSYNMFRDLNFL